MPTVVHKVTDGSYPRHFGSTTLLTDRLKIAYIKYEFNSPHDEDSIALNLIFTHGTGMNKSLWKYYVEKLYEYSRLVGANEKWYIDRVLAIDSATHGDSALLNEGKLGWQCRWEDGGRDINCVVKHEQMTTGDFLNGPRSRNILIGHSLGACQSIFSIVFEPTLYDLAFMIEPVAYTDEKSNPVFYKIIMRLSKILRDEFATEKQFEDYFTKYGVLRNFHPTILRDVLDDEKRIELVKDPLGKVILRKWKTKSSVPQQLYGYMAGTYSIPAVMRTLPLIRTPVVHVGATKGAFNPPRTIPFFREQVPREYLTSVDIAEGEHNVNGERPDEIIEELKKCLTERARKAHEHKPLYPEIEFNNDRKKIMDSKWKYMVEEGKFNIDEKSKL